MNWDETNQDTLALKLAIVSGCAEKDGHHGTWCGQEYTVAECSRMGCEIDCLKEYMKEKGVV